MNLLLQRHQRRSLFGANTYSLDVTLVPTAEELHTIRVHGLTSNHLFVVPERDSAKQLSDTAFERSDNRSLFYAPDAGRLLTDTLTGIVQATRAHFAYVVTVADVIDGTTITCPDLYQLLDCEQQITAAFDQLHRDVENALAFSIGREQVLVPEDTEDEGGLPPAAWANPQPRWR